MINLEKALELRKGKPMSAETKRKISETMKRKRMGRTDDDTKRRVKMGVGVVYNKNKDFNQYQKKVLSEYQEEAYLDVNDYLRGEISEQEIRGSDYDVTGIIRTIDSTFNKAPRFPSGRVEVYRGIEGLHGLKVGSRIVEKGFLSVSTSQELAANFAGTSDPVLLRIQAKGPYINMGTEKELILPRGLRLGVTKVSHETIKSSTGKIEATVVYAALQTARKK